VIIIAIVLGVHPLHLTVRIASIQTAIILFSFFDICLIGWVFRSAAAGELSVVMNYMNRLELE